MSQQQKTSPEEIDLLYLFKMLKRGANRWVRRGFEALDFMIKNWIVLLVLLVLGIAGGYYLQKNTTRDKEAKILVQVNYDSGDYVYNAADLLSQKLSEKRDKAFFETHGLTKAKGSIMSLTIEPLIDVLELTEDYVDTDRNLDALLRYVEFNMDDAELYETFETDYKHHVITVQLRNSGSKADLQALMDYFNKGQLVEAVTLASYAAIEEKIKENNESVRQINGLLDGYITREANRGNSSAAYFVEGNDRPDLLLEQKTLLTRENLKLRKELVLSKAVVVPMSGLEVYPMPRSILDNKQFMVPFLLVGGFLFLALLRHVFIKLRAIANSEDA